MGRDERATAEAATFIKLAKPTWPRRWSVSSSTINIKALAKAAKQANKATGHAAVLGAGIMGRHRLPVCQQEHPG